MQNINLDYFSKRAVILQPCSWISVAMYTFLFGIVS